MLRICLVLHLGIFLFAFECRVFFLLQCPENIKEDRHQCSSATRTTGYSLMEQACPFIVKRAQLIRSRIGYGRRAILDHTPTQLWHCDWLEVMSISLDPPFMSQVTFCMHTWKLCFRSGAGWQSHLVAFKLAVILILYYTVSTLFETDAQIKLRLSYNSIIYWC